MPITKPTDPRFNPEVVSEAERMDIARWLSNTHRTPADEIPLIAQSMYVAKFPRYISGGPGFCGTVYMIVWDGGPEMVTIITRTRNGEVHVFEGELAQASASPRCPDCGAENEMRGHQTCAYPSNVLECE